jgi:hypothetical protein
VFEKSYEASERAQRLDDEAAAKRALHEGEPPQPGLGERLRGWWRGRNDQPPAADDSDSPPGA